MQCVIDIGGPKLTSVAALQLQNLYDRLIDYEPTVDYQHRLRQISHAIDKDEDANSSHSIGKRGLWTSLLAQKEKRDSLALTRVLTDREAAQRLNSPKGLMLHGEVGTGKSMLVDLFADCLPMRKKRRWHFNTFMLETLARLEHLRQNRSGDSIDEHPLLVLARDLIQTSPVLFLDEFQLPDRVSSKIMSSLMTSFFQLGGVLIATSNRMPDELAKAAGAEFTPPPPSRVQAFGQHLGLRGNAGKSERMFTGKSEFAGFLELLKSRCEVWEMEGRRDYRRRLSDDEQVLGLPSGESVGNSDDVVLAIDTGLQAEDADSIVDSTPGGLPRMFFVRPSSDTANKSETFASQFDTAQHLATSSKGSAIPWKDGKIVVYGRTVPISRLYNGVVFFTFDELCCTRLGAADYITLASTFHTLILSNVPVLTVLQKNEARRFITLLDALYEARCKLLISAAAGPDDLFFPDQKRSDSATGIVDKPEEQDQDATYAETFSEAYQDATSPFRPNVSSYESEVDTTHARLQAILSQDALEDDPPNRIRRISSFLASAEKEGMNAEEASGQFERTCRGLDFAQTGAFTGEDEKFAYKRARSRIWEMCGARWWGRNEEGWWKPVPLQVRHWERSAQHSQSSAAVPPASDTRKSPGEGIGESRAVDQVHDSLLYEHRANPLSASPFRSHSEPPPRFSVSHFWGVMKWGKKAGAWGQGVEGLKERKKDVGNDGIDKR